MLVRSDATVQQRYWTVSLATDLDSIRRGMKIEVWFISYKNCRTNNIFEEQEHEATECKRVIESFNFELFY